MRMLCKESTDNSKEREKSIRINKTKKPYTKKKHEFVVCFPLLFNDKDIQDIRTEI